MTHDEARDSGKHTNKFITYSLAVIAGIFIAFAIMDFVDDSVPGWSEEERIAYMEACEDNPEGSSEEYRLSREELNNYCTCTYYEIIKIFPDGPGMHRPDPADSERIMTFCFDEASS